MRLKILAPHQTVDGRPVEPGDLAEVSNKTIARQMINSGYAIEIGEAETAIDPGRLYNTPVKTEPVPGETKKRN